MSRVEVFKFGLAQLGRECGLGVHVFQSLTVLWEEAAVLVYIIIHVCLATFNFKAAVRVKLFLANYATMFWLLFLTGVM